MKTLFKKDKTKYSESLNGYWEEGYHYYVEIRDGAMTVRDYRREIALETHISYDADRLERGERTVISTEDSVLSRDGSGNPFTMIEELAYENGELKLLYYYTIMGETLYTLKKVPCGPFEHIIIRDEEYLPRLQGRWVEWSKNGKRTDSLTIFGDRLTIPGANRVQVHVVSYKYDRDRVYIVPANLTSSDFGAWTQIEVLPDMLTTRMIVFDASVPLSVFARADMLDKIEIPPAAKEPIRSTMTHIPGKMFMPIGFKPEPTAPEKKEKKEKKEGAACCPCCGFELGADHGKFCPECGSML
ncbi:MAG: zinc ribbon domain-containing protein [Clostridia bacterium]|nr:zinc ribbon domain-containing protein [Clostridia bacterium]